MTKLIPEQIKEWQQATQDVKQLKKSKNSYVEKREFFYTNEHHFSKLKYESEVAYNATMLNEEFTEADFKTKHAQHGQDDIKSARKSVDNKTQLNLKNGKIRYQDRIDLHGMLLKQAHEQLTYFLQTSQRRGLKCVLVIHGKGTNTQTNIGQIKQQIPHWLENLDCVLSFTSSLPKHGGTGAMYVLLRKPSK